MIIVIVQELHVLSKDGRGCIDPVIWMVGLGFIRNTVIHENRNPHAFGFAEPGYHGENVKGQESVDAEHVEGK